ncbi:MAG TPA: hypothetical protein VKF37_01930 [Chloroflexota bacterium]|nr:hypothetical protein [Chloroflexota bacterium]
MRWRYRFPSKRCRLIYPVATAHWTVVHLTPDFTDPAVAVTSDVGYCLMRHRAGGPVGYAIPLRPDAILVLHKGPGHLWLRWTGEEWVADGIRGVTAPTWNVADFNDAMAGTATEVYGPTATVVDECARTGERTPPPPYAPGAGPPG